MPAGNFGVIGTQHIDMNPVVDETLLRSLDTASGLTLADLVLRLDAAMQAVNNGVPEPLARFMFATSEREIEPRVVGRKYVQRGGEFTTARSQYVGAVSFMKAIRKYEIATEFTEDGLFEMSQAAFDREMQAIVDAFHSIYIGETLSTWFDPTLMTVTETSAVKAPRLAGSGSGDYLFAGTYPNGSAIPGGYTHYYRVAVADLATAIKTQVAQLNKWQSAPYDLLPSGNAADAITALAGFVPAAETGINPAAGVATAALDPDEYLGQLPGRVRVLHPLDALGTGSHYSIAKSYGPGDPRNFLSWLWDERWGRDAYVRAKGAYPLEGAVALQRFGINVENPTGAVVCQIAASGSYTPPTVTF